MLLVLVLLGAIYRSPLIALMPLVVVGFAYAVAQGLIYLYAKSGATVSSNATSILVVLMFGVGTDYCLLLVSRYREELRTHEDKHDAMARALRRAGPAILASGLTVALSMLVLLRGREPARSSSLGPVAAIGVTCSCCSPGLTLLPGDADDRRAAGVLAAPAARSSTTPSTRCRRTGASGAGSATASCSGPGSRWPSPSLFFGVGALGLLAYKEDYSTTNVLQEGDRERGRLPGAGGARFPAGALSPTTVLVEREDGPVRPTDVAPARRLVASAAGRGRR